MSNQGIPQGTSTEKAVSPPPAVPATVETRQTFEIEGKQYTEEELKAALSDLDGIAAKQKEQQAAYTRQTQDIARKRKEAEELERRAQDLILRAERAEREAYPSEEDGVSDNLRPITDKLNKLTEIVEEDRRIRVQRETEAEAAFNRRQAIQSLKGRPFVNDASIAEIESFMEKNSLGPEHVGIAYNALFAAQLGELRGRQYAIAKGDAAGPPIMGSGNTRISPGFTSPSEAPGTAPDVSKMSWDEMKVAAMNSPDKPAF